MCTKIRTQQGTLHLSGDQRDVVLCFFYIYGYDPLSWGLGRIKRKSQPTDLQEPPFLYGIFRDSVFYSFQQCLAINCNREINVNRLTSVSMLQLLTFRNYNDVGKRKDIYNVLQPYWA